MGGRGSLQETGGKSLASGDGGESLGNPSLGDPWEASGLPGAGTAMREEPGLQPGVQALGGRAWVAQGQARGGGKQSGAFMGYVCAYASDCRASVNYKEAFSSGVPFVPRSLKC